MKLNVRRSHERGHFDHGWLKTYHTFSFADYYDPNFMGFSVLRVINEDLVAPGRGFGTHGHRDMEIITYVIAGELEHKDSMGNTSIIRPGEVQRMSAGTGVRHSEFNPRSDADTYLLQIWILPDQNGYEPSYEPSYEQRDFSDALKSRELVLVASQNGENNSVRVHQNVKLYAARLPSEKTLKLPLAKDRMGWLQIVKGDANFAGETLSAGDGVGMSEYEGSEFVTSSDCEILFFDLPS